MKCEGVKVSGYWKGWPCVNDAEYETADGKHYCHAHYAIGLNHPERFEKAIKAREKQMARYEKLQSKIDAIRIKEQWGNEV